MTKIISNKSNVDLDYPVVRPSLDLDFTQEELDPRITFSRGSIGTRVNRNRLIETVDANQPRFDYDPVTGECKGLLIEESRQNLISYSEDFDDASWSKGETSIFTNSSTSPDGTTSADILTPSTVNAQHQITKTVSGLSDNTIYTSSIFIKKFGNQFSWCRLTLRSKDGTFTGVYFNVDTKQFGTSIGGALLVSYGYIQYPNGWIRLYITTNTSTGATTPNYLFYIANGNGVLNYSYSNSQTDGLYLWGAQLEASGTLTSYIPTTASTVTRTAELADMTGSNFSSWYNQTEGTFVFDGTLPFITNDILTTGNSARVPFGVSNGLNFSNSMYVSKGTTSLGISFSVINNNVGQVQGNNTITTMTSSRFKISAAFADKNIYLSGYGGAINKPSKPTAAIPTVNRLTLGKEPWNVSPGNPIIGHIARFTYYPRALKPAQLQYLTQ